MFDNKNIQKKMYTYVRTRGYFQYFEKLHIIKIFDNKVKVLQL